MLDGISTKQDKFLPQNYSSFMQNFIKEEWLFGTHLQPLTLACIPAYANLIHRPSKIAKPQDNPQG